MELIEGYLKDVKSHLPTAEADDIIRELGENLRAEIDDRQAELGRPLTGAETEAVLVRHGNPVQVAARYRSDGRSLVLGHTLIGPLLFPIYRRVLAVTLIVTLVVRIVLGFVFAAERSPAQLVSGALVHLLIQLAIVTGVFMVVERHMARNPHLWSPRTPHAMWRPAGAGPPSRVPHILDLVVNVVAGLCWLALPAILRPFVAEAAPVLTPGPSWPPFYFAVLLLTAVQIGLAGWAIARPGQTRFREVSLTFAYGMASAIGFYVLSLGSWVVAAGAGGGSESARRLAATIDLGCDVSVLAMAVVSAVLCLLGVWRLRRRKRTRTALVAM